MEFVAGCEVPAGEPAGQEGHKASQTAARLVGAGAGFQRLKPPARNGTKPRKLPRGFNCMNSGKRLETKAMYKKVWRRVSQRAPKPFRSRSLYSAKAPRSGLRGCCRGAADLSARVLGTHPTNGLESTPPSSGVPAPVALIPRTADPPPARSGSRAETSRCRQEIVATLAEEGRRKDGRSRRSHRCSRPLERFCSTQNPRTILQHRWCFSVKPHDNGPVL